MKKHLLFIKNHYLILLTVLFIICLIAIGYSEYQQKKMYKDQISSQLRSDISKIANQFMEIDRFYDSILTTNQYNYQATRNEADFIYIRLRDIMLLTDKWFFLSQDFGYLDEYPTKYLGDSLSTVSTYFFEVVKTDQPITDKDKKILLTFQSYNKALIKALTKSELFQPYENALIFKEKYKESALQVSDLVWLRTLLLLEKESTQFLEERHLQKLSDVISREGSR
ncbi:hypothetical protein ABE099_17740 [Paenibacillus turicensis]|uniref:hypothetical protein n=1 Tax=Paenibacillus turicensis TaxID=160487 RepID=UPI003D27E12E